MNERTDRLEKPRKRKRQTKTIREWAQRINASWQKAVESILETGNLLIEAKAALSHGQWGQMFSWRRWTGPVPFSERTAQMLMTIARHPILSNPKFVADLPPSWGTLYELISIPDAQLEKLIEEGTINPGITRKEVRQFSYWSISAVPRAVMLIQFFQEHKPAQWVADALEADQLWRGVIWTDADAGLPLSQYFAELMEAAHKHRKVDEEAAEREIARIDAEVETEVEGKSISIYEGVSMRRTRPLDTA